MKLDTCYIPDLSTHYALPISLGRIPAGFPSPADDHLEGRLDLTRHLIKHPAATFLWRATGDSMIGAGIHSGDLLIVDRSLEAKDRDVVVVVLDGEFTVKRLAKRQGAIQLLPENSNYQPVTITASQTCEIWGVVTNVIHPL